MHLFERLAFLNRRERGACMFTDFFLELKQARVPVSLREYLTLLEAMGKSVADYSVEDFYYLSRACLVKDERNLDKFDRVFGQFFKGLEDVGRRRPAIPEEWLQQARRETPDARGAERRSRRWAGSRS